MNVSFACFTDHNCIGYSWHKGVKQWCECECHEVHLGKKPSTVWDWLRKRFGVVL